MTTSAQRAASRLLGRLPPSGVWGRGFRDLCLNIIGCVVIAALGLMLRLSPGSRDLTYTAVAVLTAAALLYQAWRLWPLTTQTQTMRLLVPVLTVAAMLGATAGLHAAALLAVWTICTMPRDGSWGRGAVTIAAAAPLMIATVQTLSLTGPTPLLLLGLALPGVVWWPAAQRVLNRIPVRVHVVASAALALITLLVVGVQLAAL